MSLHVIELNDSAIKLGDDNGILLTSPGFALADGKDLFLGEAAEQQARLKPTSSFNKYWQELSMEPFGADAGFRHLADIAHAHLMHLSENSGVESDVIFAVPGNFSQQQLAILLGIAGQTPMRPVGVVDSALATAIASATAERIIYVDMQLHQVVLTSLKLGDDHLERGDIIQIPGVGSQNFMDLLMQMTTGLFIQQCRFNPQHNAESEQQLYNILPSWLKQETTEQGSLLVELNSGGNIYTAKLPREELVASLDGHYRKIEQQIQALLAGKSAQILLNPKIAELPGLTRAFKHHHDLVVIEPHAVVQGSLENQQHIVAGDAGLRRVTRLPLQEQKKAQIAEQGDSQLNPTHVLFGDQAFPAAGLEFLNRSEVNGHGGNHLLVDIDDFPERLGQIQSQGRSLVLNDACGEWHINGTVADGQTVLRLGDRLELPGKLTLNLIRVRDV